MLWNAAALGRPFALCCDKVRRMKRFWSWAKPACVGAAIVLLCATSSPATASPLHRLKEAAVGCLKQSDSKTMASLARDAQGRAEMLSAISQGRCARLHAGMFRVRQWDDGYACLAWLKQGCLWIPEDALDGTMMDDRAF
jgi:hypothetical protein